MQVTPSLNDLMFLNYRLKMYSRILYQFKQFLAMDLDHLQSAKDCETPGHLLHRPNKRYALDQMLMKAQKQKHQKKTKPLSRNAQEKKSEYFQSMRKEQNKKLFISTFIKKLKRTIVRHFPIQHETFHLHQKKKKFISGLHISPNMELLISIIAIIEISFLMILISLSTVFKSIDNSSIYFSILFLGFGFHVLDILKSIISVKSQDGKRFQSFNDIIIIYIDTQGITDFFILLAFMFQLCFHDSAITQITRFLFLFLVVPLIKKLSFLEGEIIQNVYWQQIWQLIKLFLVNYIFAHFLALVLISMSRINDSQNWMGFKGIGQKPQIQQYVWAYYWATTIMLTVGFGDLCPVTTSQALCMIFIQTISCILLAYNINNVGSIICEIRSYSQLQHTNLKIFRNLSSTNVLSSELTYRITKYINESIQMKRKSNISEQNKFIQSLPNSFKEDVLKQCNRKIFSNLLFFKNLSQKLQFQLAIQIERKLAHPQEVIHRQKDPLEIMIFNSGTMAYTYFRNSNRLLHANGKIVQQYIINRDDFKLLSLDFLFNSFFPFNVKCIDYTTVYRISTKTFVEILKGNPYDYQYFCMMKDKDKMLLNEFEVSSCDLCEKEKHSLDKCPKLHFIPIKQHIVHKFLGNRISKQLMIRLHQPRVSKAYYHTLSDKNLIRQDLLRKRNEDRESIKGTAIQKSFFIAAERFMHLQKSPLNMFPSCQKLQEDTSQQKTDAFRDSQTIYQDATEKLKDEMQKVISFHHNKAMMWDIEVDTIHDFKYYFKKFNPQKIRLSLKRKSKRKRRARP